MHGTHDHDPDKPRSRPPWGLLPGGPEADDYSPTLAAEGTPGPGVAELTHELVRGQFSDYLDDALGEATRRRIDGHLAGCPPCAAFLDTLRVTVRALGQLPAPKAPTGATARIVEQVRREHGLGKNEESEPPAQVVQPVQLDQPTASTEATRAPAEPTLIPSSRVRPASIREIEHVPNLPDPVAARLDKDQVASLMNVGEAGQPLISREDPGPPPLELAPAAIGAAILGGVLGGAYVGPLGAIVGTFIGGAAGQLLNSATSRFAPTGDSR